jgi:hypothetical protein
MLDAVDPMSEDEEEDEEEDDEEKEEAKADGEGKPKKGQKVKHKVKSARKQHGKSTTGGGAEKVTPTESESPGKPQGRKKKAPVQQKPS